MLQARDKHADACEHVSLSCLPEDKGVASAKQARTVLRPDQARTEMVGHLVHVDRATPLALESVPMGQLGPWMDPVTQLTLSRVAVLVLAAVGISVVARHKISADIINKNGTWNLGGDGKIPRNSPTDDFPSLLEAENLFNRLILHALLHCSDYTPPHLSVDPHRVRLFWAHTHTHASPLSHSSVIHNRSRPRPHSVLWTVRGPIESSSEAHSPAGVAR